MTEFMFRPVFALTTAEIKARGLWEDGTVSTRCGGHLAATRHGCGERLWRTVNQWPTDELIICPKCHRVMTHPYLKLTELEENHRAKTTGAKSD